MRLFDDRWLGKHGIGRFASEVLPALKDFVPANLSGRPSDPIEPLRLSVSLISRKPRLFFSPGYNAPVASPCPYAVTLHDLNHLHVPANSGRGRRLYYSLFLRPAVRRAALVLTVSEFSRAQICEWANLQPEQVVNVSNGVSGIFQAEGESYELGSKPYFAALGSPRPHKNFRRLLAAFAESGLATQCRLLVVGHPSAELHELVKDAQLTDAVTFAGPVEDERLAAIYRGALALVFPSIYEGFGLPIVEAMACGTPVITSNLTAMPEVAGGAALLVNPLSSSDLAGAMQRLASDQGLRRKLSTLGLVRASAFSWEKTRSAVSRAIKPWA